MFYLTYYYNSVFNKCWCGARAVCGIFLSHDWINTSLYAPASEIIRCAKYPCQTPTLETTSTHFCSTWIYDTRIAQTWIFAFAVQKDDDAKNILSEDCLRVEHPLLNDNTMFLSKVKPFFILSKLSHVQSISLSRALREKYLQWSQLHYRKAAGMLLWKSGC